jgi:[ribosomal protein S18]-alanine N-acetyltransferase
MTIRKYQSGDFEGIMSLWMATGMGRPERGDDAQTVERSLAMGGCMFVMTDDESERIIGTSWITYDGRRLLLHHFGILPEYQRRGFSKELLKKSLRFVKQKNIQVKLEVHRNNIIARNLYINAGFEYLGDYDVYILRDIERI